MKVSIQQKGAKVIEVGKRYKLVTTQLREDGYEDVTQWVTVTKVDGNLIEDNGHTIFNLASPLVHSITDEEAEKAYLAELSKQIDVRFELPEKVVDHSHDDDDDTDDTPRNPATGY